MKNLKVKSILFSLLAMMAVAVFMTSCEQESITGDDDVEGLGLSSLLEEYPEEITIDNWEDFVHAPEEVIDYHQEQELSTTASPTVQSEELQSSIEDRTPCGPNGECGFVKAFNTSVGWNCLQGVNTQGGGCSDTSFGGCFNFGVGHDVNYVVCPGGQICMSYQTHWLNGVSTLDLVLIQKHILGIQPFTNVRQYIAADINGNGTISAVDLIELRKLILGIYASIPNRENIIFLPEGDYDYFNQNMNAISGGPLYTFINSSNCNFSENRYAIKTGDVNGTFSF